MSYGIEPNTSYHLNSKTMKHENLIAALLAFVMLGACTESPEEGGGFLPS